MVNITTTQKERQKLFRWGENMNKFDDQYIEKFQPKGKKLRCKLGFHEWETTHSYPCSVKAASVFTYLPKVDAIAKIQRCVCCPAERGLLKTNLVTQEYDLELLKSSLRDEGIQI
jgi:hypothetical protein